MYFLAAQAFLSQITDNSQFSYRSQLTHRFEIDYSSRVMKSYSMIFPGQGSQRKGMGLDFYEQFPSAKLVFDEANSVLPFDILEVIQSDDERLNQTSYTQPCILTTEIAMLSVLREEAGLQTDYYGGHSLGEYTALVAAGVMPFAAAVQIVHKRGDLMQNSTPLGFGAMSAVIGDALPLAELSALADSFEVDVANDNSNDQVVLSGESTQVEKLSLEIQKRFEELRLVPLNVSAPFHSRHMKEIEEPFRQVLESYQKDFDSKNLARVTSNFSGQFHTGSLDDLITDLTAQLSGRVRWRDNMVALHEKGLALIELGPHRPLKAFFKTLGVDVTAIINYRSAKKVFPELEAATAERKEA